MRPKHRKDHNNGKGGMVAGNPRYKRTQATVGKNRTMTAPNTGKN